MPHRLQAELLLKRQDFKPAIKALDRALALNSKDAQAYRLRAYVHQQLGQAARSRADWAQACKLGDTAACGK